MRNFSCKHPCVVLHSETSCYQTGSYRGHLLGSHSLSVPLARVPFYRGSLVFDLYQSFRRIVLDLYLLPDIFLSFIVVIIVISYINLHPNHTIHVNFLRTSDEFIFFRISLYILSFEVWRYTLIPLLHSRHCPKIIDSLNGRRFMQTHCHDLVDPRKRF